jgi:hypothetical protein
MDKEGFVVGEMCEKLERLVSAAAEFGAKSRLVEVARNQKCERIDRKRISPAIQVSSYL